METNKVNSIQAQPDQQIPTPAEGEPGQMQGRQFRPINRCNYAIFGGCITMAGLYLIYQSSATPCLINGTDYTCFEFNDHKPAYKVGFTITCIGLSILGFTITS